MLAPKISSHPRYLSGILSIIGKHLIFVAILIAHDNSKTALNTGYLHDDKGFNGAYFIATLKDDDLEVAVHGLDESWKGFVCPKHQWYGRQFIPEKFGCGLCKFSPTHQFMGMASLAFRETTAIVGFETVSTVARTQSCDHICHDFQILL
jgi:hypothetical protein